MRWSRPDSIAMLPFSTRFFCWLGLSFGAAGGGYFLTLAVGLPFTVAIIFVVCATTAMGWWLLRGTGETPRPAGTYVAAVVAGTALMLYRSLDFLEKHGSWDAWALWNYHARMLTDPQRWRNLFQPLAYDHPDYPLCLPAGLAFLTRAFPGMEIDSPSIVVTFAGMFAVALLLFGELFRRRPWVGIAALFLLTQDDVFLRLAVLQYADTLLAFYLLIAVVAMDYVATDRRAAIIAGAAIGLSIWTKNEGLILAALMAVCYAPRLLRRPVGFRFIAGLATPLAWWLIFKTAYAPPNDLSGQTATALIKSISAAGRFATVWEELRRVVREDYAIAAWLVVLCAGTCIARREAPHRGFLLVIFAFLAYCAIFLVSPYDPAWHVRTAFTRLLHQLLPTLLYACGAIFARYVFLPAQKLPR